MEDLTDVLIDTAAALLVLWQRLLSQQDIRERMEEIYDFTENDRIFAK